MSLGASIVAQLVKNLPAIQKTLVQFLGWEVPLEAGMATHSSILAWRTPMDRGAWQATWGRKESDTSEWLSTQYIFVVSRKQCNGLIFMIQLILSYSHKDLHLVGSRVRFSLFLLPPSFIEVWLTCNFV